MSESGRPRHANWESSDVPYVMQRPQTSNIGFRTFLEQPLLTESIGKQTERLEGIVSHYCDYGDDLRVENSGKS